MPPSIRYPLGELTLAESNYIFLTMNPTNHDQARVLVAYQQQGGKLYVPSKIPSSLADSTSLSIARSQTLSGMKKRANVFSQLDVLGRGLNLIKRLRGTSRASSAHSSRLSDLDMQNSTFSLYDEKYFEEVSRRKSSFSWHPTLPKFTVCLEDDTIAFGETLEIPLYQHTLLAGTTTTTSTTSTALTTPSAVVKLLTTPRANQAVGSSSAASSSSLSPSSHAFGGSMSQNELQWAPFVLAHPDQKNVSQVAYSPVNANIIAVACDAGVGIWLVTKDFKFSSTPPTASTDKSTIERQSSDVTSDGSNIPVAVKPRITLSAAASAVTADFILSAAASTNKNLAKASFGSPVSLFDLPITSQIPSVTASTLSAEKISPQVPSQASSHTPSQTPSLSLGASPLVGSSFSPVASDFHSAFFALHNTAAEGCEKNPVHSIAFSPCGRYILFSTTHTVEVIAVHETLASSLAYQQATVGHSTNSNPSAFGLGASGTGTEKQFILFQWVSQALDVLRENFLETQGKSFSFSSRSELLFTCGMSSAKPVVLSMAPGHVSFAPNGKHFFISSRSDGFFHIGVVRDWSLATFRTVDGKPVRAVAWCQSGKENEPAYTSSAPEQVVLMSTWESTKIHALSVFPGASFIPKPSSLFTRKREVKKHALGVSSDATSSINTKDENLGDFHSTETGLSLNLGRVLQAAVGSLASLADSLVVNSKLVLDVHPFTAWCGASEKRTSQVRGRSASTEFENEMDRDDSDGIDDTNTTERREKFKKPVLVISNLALNPTSERLAITFSSSFSTKNGLVVKSNTVRGGKPSFLPGEELVVIADVTFKPLLRLNCIGAIRGPPITTAGYQPRYANGALVKSAKEDARKLPRPGMVGSQQSILSSGLRKHVGYDDENSVTTKAPFTKTTNSTTNATIDDIDDDFTHNTPPTSSIYDEREDFFGSARQKKQQKQRQSLSPSSLRTMGDSDDEEARDSVSLRGLSTSSSLSTSIIPNRPISLSFHSLFDGGALLAIVWENQTITYCPMMFGKKPKGSEDANVNVLVGKKHGTIFFPDAVRPQ